MSITVLAEERPIARKEHRCGGCGSTIGVGDRYLRQRNAYDGSVYTSKSHALCAEIGWRIARDYGLGDDEPIDTDSICSDLADLLTLWPAPHREPK